MERFRKRYAFDIRKMYKMAISRPFSMLFFNPLHCKILLLAWVFSLFLDRRESTVFFYHLWLKNRVRCIGGRRAPSPNALFSILWRAISVQKPFFTFLFVLLFSCFCMNDPFIKILLLALVKHTFVKTVLIKRSFHAYLSFATR